jgi:hypothetical protein
MFYVFILRHSSSWCLNSKTSYVLFGLSVLVMWIRTLHFFLVQPDLGQVSAVLIKVICQLSNVCEEEHKCIHEGMIITLESFLEFLHFDTIW